MTRQNLLRSHTLLRCLLGLLLVALPTAALADPPPIVLIEPVTSGLESPVAITHAGDGSGRLFITQQGGQIVIFENGSLLATPFLDVDPLASGGSERGLLSVAFHPDYETNGFLFVNYTDNAGDTVIARYSVLANDPNQVDPSSATVLMVIDQPGSNHNGGQLQFGPDGFLYIGMGDGGGAGDPANNAQNPQLLLGKMLRIDVDGALPYEIPADNPFVGDATTLDEIWAIGVRNPWRFSFDRLTGDLLIADVGQSDIEEINFQPAGSPGGENYGWRLMEGSSCFNPAAGCNDGTLTLPIVEYTHAEGCSITGGTRYRGKLAPALDGAYIFGDYCSGTIWSATENAGTWQRASLLQTAFSISTFGEDEDGELYVADLSFGTNGTVYRIVTAPACEVELTQPNYTNGEIVTASTLRLSNPSGSPVETELKIWLGTPSAAASFVNVGADGALDLPAGLDLDLGPLPFLPVNAGTPIGQYEFSCRMLDPVTGALLSEDRERFDIE